MAEQSTNTKTEGGTTSGGATSGGATKGGTTSGAATGGSSRAASGVSSDTNTSSATGTAEDLRQKVASTVASAADTQKNRAADGLGSIADVARQTGEDLRGQNEMLASWVNAASDQLRSIADRLRDRPAAELADDLASFARQRPALFIGGAFLLGLGVARLLKASPDTAYGRRDYGYSGMREGDYRETGMGGTLSGNTEGRSSGEWARDTGAY